MYIYKDFIGEQHGNGIPFVEVLNSLIKTEFSKDISLSCIKKADCLLEINLGSAREAQILTGSLKVDPEPKRSTSKREFRVEDTRALM